MKATRLGHEEAKELTQNTVKAMQLAVDLIELLDKVKKDAVFIGGNFALAEPTPFVEAIKKVAGYEPTPEQFDQMNESLLEYLSIMEPGQVNLCDLFDFGHALWHIFWPHA